MKTALRLAFCGFCSFVIFCSPPPHDKNDPAQKGVLAINERVWLGPLINNSNITSIEGWPEDSIQRMIIMQRFDKIEAKLLSELRRCEKYGLYTVVEDSSEASMTMSLTLMPFSRDHDTVTIPAEVVIQTTVPRASNTFKYSPKAHAFRDMRDKNPFHYVGLIMMDYVKNFPYKNITHLLYRSGK